MENNKINGFGESQIFQLYAYLVAYEDSGIGKYTSTKAMLHDHPELSELNEILKTVKCKKSKSNEEFKSINLKDLKNEIYQTMNKQNHLLSFLAHLRNSIAHGAACLIEGGDVQITDFANPRFSPVDFNARGRVSLDTVTKITEILNKIDL